MNELIHLTEFKAALANYKVSPESKEILRNTNLVLFVAATSSGRNTIIKKLLKTGDYHFLVSDTTRKKRDNDGVMEQDGVEYWFRSEEDVLQDIKAGKFLEAAVIHNQQVSGISIRELKRAQEAGKIGITDIEVVGTDLILEAKPDSTAIFLLPPSFDEWMKRLKHRGGMNEDERTRRLQSAVVEIETALSKPYYTMVINDDLDDCVEQIDALARKHTHDKTREHKAILTAQRIIEDTKNHLTL